MRAIMLDIDGTLYDKKYNVNESRLKPLLNSRKECIILNSNRSREDIKKVQKQFGLSGPAICENGCFIVEQGRETILTNYPKISPIKKEVKQILEKYGSWKEEDTVKAISEKPTEGKKEYSYVTSIESLQ